MTLTNNLLSSFTLLASSPLALLGSLLLTFLLVFLLIHLVPYVSDPHGFRTIPGPFVAKFSTIWIGWITAKGHRSEVVHALHLKYGASPSHTPLSNTRLL